jgi:U32 family peptidase
VMADVGCRNTVFEGRAQTAAGHLPLWLDAGIRDLRLEFVHEDAAGVSAVVAAFRAALAGELGAEGLDARLAAVGGQGVTQGSLFVPAGAEVGDFSGLPQLL